MQKRRLSCFFIGFICFGIISTCYCKDIGPRKASGNKSDMSSPKVTFLDTLNRGKELNLAKSEVVPISAGKETGSPQKKKVNPNGYRIQLMASSSEEMVRSEKRSIEKNLQLTVYIDFDEPYYKVYVGDYVSKRSANRALSKIKESGYPDAWIVKSKVFVDE